MDASDGVVARHAAGSADYRGRVPGGCERRSPPRIAVRPRKSTEVRLLAVEESCATVTRLPSFFLLRRRKEAGHAIGQRELHAEAGILLRDGGAHLGLGMEFTL